MPILGITHISCQASAAWLCKEKKMGEIKNSFATRDLKRVYMVFPLRVSPIGGNGTQRNCPPVQRLGRLHSSCSSNIDTILLTVFQLRSVIGTPSAFSLFAASLLRPTPSGANR